MEQDEPYQLTPHSLSAEYCITCCCNIEHSSWVDNQIYTYTYIAHKNILDIILIVLKYDLSYCVTAWAVLSYIVSKKSTVEETKQHTVSSKQKRKY